MKTLKELKAPAPLSSEAVGKKIDPLISEFVELMVSQLEANAGRGDWKEGLGMSYTIDAIARNLRDLQGYTPAETRTCADIANFALMHWIFRTMGRRAEALLTPSPSEKALAHLDSQEQVCPECKGTGEVPDGPAFGENKPCPTCGTGKAKKE